MKISDMNIVVTGANGAIGSILIEYFSKRAAFVAGTIRQLSKNMDRGNTVIIEMDPLNNFSIDNAINLINNEAGAIHVWMNIVGGFIMGNHVDDVEHDAWNYMYNTNFMTTLNCCQKILPKMKVSGFGRIVNMGSQAAVRGMPLAGSYCISKAAVHTLTKIIALENGGSITCNAILPGIVDTPENRQMMQNADYSNWTSLRQIAVQIERLLLSDENGVLIHA